MFARAAIIKQHRLSHVNSRVVFSRSSGGWKSRSRCWQGAFLRGLLSLAVGGCLPSVSSQGLSSCESVFQAPVPSVFSFGHAVQHVGLSSLTKGRTRILCGGRTVLTTGPLGESPNLLFLKGHLRHWVRAHSYDLILPL